MTVRYVPRSEWGGGPVRAGYQVPETQIVGLVGHHTVIPRRFPNGSIAGVKAYMRQLQTSRPDLGNEVPYSFVVFPGATADDAIVAEGRGKGRSGAHTIGYNSTRYGVAFAGNASTEPVGVGVVDAYEWVGATMLVDPAGARPTLGHRDVYPTECPGNNLYPRLPQPPFAVAAPIPIPDFRNLEEDPMFLFRVADKAGPAFTVRPGEQPMKLTSSLAWRNAVKNPNVVDVPLPDRDAYDKQWAEAKATAARAVNVDLVDG